jgi:hypothetical protein
MKTVSEYLEQLPEPARARAQANMYQEYGNEWSYSLPAALKRAFIWHRSPEGYSYWYVVYSKLYYTSE